MTDHMEISCIRLIRDCHNARYWFLIFYVSGLLVLLWIKHFTCNSRWVSLMILLGRFAISPLYLAADNPINHPPTPKTCSLCNCSVSKIDFLSLSGFSSTSIIVGCRHNQGLLEWQFWSRASLQSQSLTPWSPFDAALPVSLLWSLEPQ